ncbi:unnamed protein product [Calypogeia fissa]
MGDGRTCDLFQGNMRGKLKFYSHQQGSDASALAPHSSGVDRGNGQDAIGKVPGVKTPRASKAKTIHIYLLCFLKTDSVAPMLAR